MARKKLILNKSWKEIYPEIEVVTECNFQTLVSWAYFLPYPTNACDSEVYVAITERLERHIRINIQVAHLFEGLLEPLADGSYSLIDIYDVFPQLHPVQINKDILPMFGHKEGIGTLACENLVLANEEHSGEVKNVLKKIRASYGDDAVLAVTFPHLGTSACEEIPILLNQMV